MPSPAPLTCTSRGSGTEHGTAEPIGYHVTIRLEDDRLLAMTTDALRVVVRVVLAQGERRGLLAFGVADDHLHAELATNRTTAGSFALYVQTALQQRLRPGARFEAARIRPLHDQRHAYNTFHYVHRQDARHALQRDRICEGTSLPDLLGMRILTTSIGSRVRVHLPRVRRQDLVEKVPAGVFDETPVKLELLADAAAAALAIPDLDGRCPDSLRARRAAVHAAGLDVPARLLGDCLGIGPRAVQSLRTHASEPAVVRAVEMQARWRSLATTPPG